MAPDGFFEQAKAELLALAARFVGLAQTDPTNAHELLSIAAFAQQYEAVYCAIQDTQASRAALRDAKVREAQVAGVHAQLFQGRGELVDGRPGPHQRRGFAGCCSPFVDMKMFLAGWGDVSSMSDQTNASPLMWGAFLQTVERQRTILNQYGKLEGAVRPKAPATRW